MKVLSLRWRDYRNLQEGAMEPCAGMNVLYGGNAQGKTNVLEALWLFTGSHSFRGSRDAELPRHGAGQARLELRFYSEEREQEAAIRLENGRRYAALNGVPLRGAGQLCGRVGAVIFSPEHIALVREGPAGRRDFLDAALCQLRPGYVKLLNRYQHTLAQRNALLKDIVRHRELAETLPIWDERLCADGLRMVAQREAYVQRLAPMAGEIYAGLSQGAEALQLRYCRSAPDMAAALRAQAALDVQRGFTGAGPHRDELALLLDGQPARAFASQGQKRSIVLALKLAEARMLERLRGEKPLVLLDDVLSELDPRRQAYLLQNLSGCQTFLTCCEPGNTERMAGGALFQVEQGCVTRQALPLDSGEKEEEGGAHVPASGTGHSGAQ